ncbi:MAG: NAD kinase [Alphaproteobacteria bacterium]|nr:NAD kinase [Alphaproteobacteria bacterium]
MSSDNAIAFIASDAPEAQAALTDFSERFPSVPASEASVVVAFGGDGFMLQAMHQFVSTGKTIYGMNRGSVGFLMNEYSETALEDRLARANVTEVHPLRMEAEDAAGNQHNALAFNEVSLLRQTYQAAKLSLAIDGRTRLDELICDGVLLSTPAGSTAYNLSAHGPILPVNSPLLALTPISAFRPRRWRGAILPCEAEVTIEVLEPEKRPVSAVADHDEFRNIRKVHIAEDQSQTVRLMFDEGHSLEERVLSEQFRY